MATPSMWDLQNSLFGGDYFGARDRNSWGGFDGAGGNGGAPSGPTSGAHPGFNDPGLTAPQSDVYAQLQKLIGGGPDIQGFINQGMNSPLLQSILQPALAQQARQFAGQRQNLTDAMRATGGLRSSQYGVNLNKLAGEQSTSQGNLMSQIIAQTLNPLLQSQMEAYKAPISAYGSLFNALPQQTFWPGFAPQNVSGGGGGGGGFGTADRSMGGGPSTGPQYGAINPNFQPNPSGGGGQGGGPGSWYEPGGVMGQGGGGIAYNPVTGSYESVNDNFNQPTYSNGFDNQQYTDYGQYVNSYGLGYDPSGDLQTTNDYGQPMQYNYPDQSGWSMQEWY